MNAPAPARLAHILLDETSVDVTKEWITWLVTHNDAFREPIERHIVDYQTWELTPDSLHSLYGECEYDDMTLMARDRIAWYAMYDYVEAELCDEEEFRDWDTQILAREIAGMLLSDDDIEADICPLVVVHSDTAQQNGFIPLIRALHKEQTERGHDLAQVYIHDGTIRSIRPFQESPVTTRQA